MLGGSSLSRSKGFRVLPWPRNLASLKRLFRRKKVVARELSRSSIWISFSLNVFLSSCFVSRSHDPPKCLFFCLTTPTRTTHSHTWTGHLAAASSRTTELVVGEKLNGRCYQDTFGGMVSARRARQLPPIERATMSSSFCRCTGYGFHAQRIKEKNLTH